MKQHFRYVKPDYTNSIVNVMSSLLQHLGKKPLYQPLQQLPPAMLKHYKTIALVVIDGLGEVLLHEHQASFLKEHHVTTITSVFPSTTAAALTSFSTAVAPQQHGYVGWFANVQELGSVVALLPMVPRIGGVHYGALGIPFKNLISWKSIYQQINQNAYVILPRAFINNEYFLMTQTPSKPIGYKNFQGFQRVLKKTLLLAEKKFIYAYWPMIDTLAHHYGTKSKKVAVHLLELDYFFQRLSKQAKQTKTLIIITADHGLLDTPAKKRINLNKIPHFHECLTTAVTGEPRAGYLFVRPKKVKQFKAIWKKYLHEKAWLYDTEHLIKKGYFGKGKPSQAFLKRSGDFVFIAKEDFVLQDFLLGEQPHWLKANHGGISEEEMRVPLLMIPLV